MPNYLQFTFPIKASVQSEMLIAHLSEAGFEGFEEGEEHLNAFIAEQELDRSQLDTIAANYDLSFEETVIPEQNWNAAWEASFEPVVVDDFVAIRADFHAPIKGVEQEIIITPKMSFGTGHHATTYLMLQMMREIGFTGKKVFDFGTGTGVLAILAEKLGAAQVLAVDHDDWSISNTAENLQRNHCHKIIATKAEQLPPGETYDVILANINKNVILGNFSSLAGQLSPGGILLLSGLLEDDEKDIMERAGKFPLVFRVKQARNKWIALRFDR